MSKSVVVDEPRVCLDVTINVLGYQEDGNWAALALEMDLRGYGKTFKEALAELMESMASQISFAEFKGQPEMAFFPAAIEYFNLYSQIRQERLRELAHLGSSAQVDQTEYQIAGVPIPSAHVIAEHMKGFAMNHE